MSAAIDLIEGQVHRIGDNVDTDAILPGRYLALREPAALGAHCLESLHPELRGQVRQGDILVAGWNLGNGSSREHAVIALKAIGIRGIVAASAARIFFRNAINLGLPVMVCPEAAAALQANRFARLLVTANRIEQDGTVWQPEVLDGEVAAILACGGLLQRTREILAQPVPATTGARHG